MRLFKNHLIFAGEESSKIAKYLSETLGIKLGDIERTRFPDSEYLIRVPLEVEGKNIIYIKSTAYPQADNLMELFLTLHAFKINKAKNIDLVIPYYAHARQDKIFETGQAKSAETVAKIIEGLGRDPKLRKSLRVYTIDAHFHRYVGPYSLFDTNIEAFNITAVKELAKHIRDKYQPNNPRVVIPDKGQQPTHKYIKEIFDTDFIFLDKKRLSSREVIISCDQDPSSLKDSDVVIFDDMISTGTTLIKSIEWLKQQDVNRVFVAATHLMYPISNGQHEDVGGKLREAGATEIISTNTTDINENGRISVAPLIGKALLNQAYA